MTRYWAAHALLPEGPAVNVTFAVDAGRFTAVIPGTAPGDAVRLPGVVLPGFANVHSHAFHRALRGRTHDQGGTFWTWRERMYAVAGRLGRASGTFRPGSASWGARGFGGRRRRGRAAATAATSAAAPAARPAPSA